MTRNRARKHAVRELASATGEPYAVAARQLADVEATGVVDHGEAPSSVDKRDSTVKYDDEHGSGGAR